MSKLTKRNINRFKENLILCNSIQHPTNYKVIEDFELHGIRSYNVVNLKFDFEDGILIFYESSGKLNSNITYVLNAFLAESVKDIEFIQQAPLDILITFSKGCISIKQA